MTNALIKKVTVGIPSNGTIKIDTSLSITVAVASTRGVMFHLSHPTSCYIHENREQIVLDAQKEKSDYVMFIDSDMAFPADGIEKLLKDDKPIVGADYHYRENPPKSVTLLDPKKLKTDDITFTIDPNDKNKRLATIDNPQKPFECRAVGTGFMLVKMEVFEKLPRPWFFFRPSSDPEGMTGEDVWFCELARKHGISVWCDPTIQVKHIGVAFY